MMKLIHKSQLIGTIKNACLQGMAMYGDIELTDAANKYLDMFSYFSGKINPFVAPPYPDSDLWGWTIELDDGTLREVIGCPAISNNGTDIAWRWGKQINKASELTQKQKENLEGEEKF